MNTKAGDQLTLNFKDCDAAGYTSSVPTRMYCALHYDAVLNINDNGIQLVNQCKTPDHIQNKFKKRTSFLFNIKKMNALLNPRNGASLTNIIDATAHRISFSRK